MRKFAISSLPEWFHVPTLRYAEPAGNRCHPRQPLSALWLLAAQEKQELSNCPTSFIILVIYLERVCI